MTTETEHEGEERKPVLTMILLCAGDEVVEEYLALNRPSILVQVADRGTRRGAV